MGDYFKAISHFLKYTEDATEVITWLRGKTLVLGLIREAQLAAGSTIAAVIRAVLTRWTSHYLAFYRLLQLHKTLLSIIYADEAAPVEKKKIVIGDAKAKAKSRRMVQILTNSLFWHALARYLF